MNVLFAIKLSVLLYMVQIYVNLKKISLRILWLFLLLSQGTGTIFSSVREITH
jgi:hypothetical protein